MTFYAIGFFVLLFSDIYMIFTKYIPGIITISVFLLLVIFFWIYSKKRQTTKERYY